MQNFEAAQQQLQGGSKTAVGLVSKPASKPAPASKSAQVATQPQQLQAAPKAVPEAQPATAVLKAVPQASSSQSAVPEPTTKSTTSAEGAPPSSLVTSGAPPPSPVTSAALPSQTVKSLQLAKASQPSQQHTQAQASSSKADALSATAPERTSATQAKARQAAAAATVADEWADKGVPVQSGYLQSGYQMPDSPLPEEDDVLSEYETSRPLSAERQQADSARPELASAQAPVAKAAATNKSVVPVPSIAPNRAQSSKDTLQEKVLLPAGKDTAQAPSSKLTSSGETDSLPKQPPNRQSSSVTVATGKTVAAPAGSAPPTADNPPLTGVKDALAALGSGVSRLSGSSSSKAQPAQPGKVSTGTSSGGQHQSLSKATETAQMPVNSAREPPSAIEATQGKPASGQVPMSTEKPAQRPGQQSPLPVSIQQQPTAPGKSAVQLKAAPAVAAERSTKSPLPSPQSPSITVKPSAPRQSSAALSGKAAAASPPLAPSNTPLANTPQLQSSPVAAPKPLQKQSGSADKAAASNATSQAARLPVVSSAQPPLPATKSQASRRETLPIPLQASPQDPPIPGLASPQKPVTVHSMLPPSATGRSRPVTASGQPEQVISEPPSLWVPPPPVEAPPQPPQIPSDPYPPEPSSPRPAPVTGTTSRKRSRDVNEPGVCSGPTPPSDSGEDMEIDEEAAPPLPTEPFPQGFELATIDSNQELVEISGEERDSLLNELSGIHVSYLNHYYVRAKI